MMFGNFYGLEKLLGSTDCKPNLFLVSLLFLKIKPSSYLASARSREDMRACYGKD